MKKWAIEVKDDKSWHVIYTGYGLDVYRERKELAERYPNMETRCVPVLPGSWIDAP